MTQDHLLTALVALSAVSAPSWAQMQPQSASQAQSLQDLSNVRSANQNLTAPSMGGGDVSIPLESAPAPAEPVQLQAPRQRGTDAEERERGSFFRQAGPLTPQPKSEPSEFEAFVREVVGRPLPRFGQSLIIEGARTFAPAPNAIVPPDYTLNPGDELVVHATGSIESDVRTVVDRSGQIHLPRVGSITVTGIRYDHLEAYLRQQFQKRFRGFDLSVSLGQLRGIRVYVTGFAKNPGSYTLGSLSTLVNAVMAAGGPSSAGSFRSMELHRGSQVASRFDLYELLLSGDKTHDIVLQSEDVIYVRPSGPQVAIFGSINAPAIYEAKQGETLSQLIGFAGGLNSVADATRFSVQRLSNRGATVVQELPLSKAGETPLEPGDVYRIFSQTDVTLPLERQAKLVRIDGEVNRPGEYLLPPGSSISLLVSKAGGLTPRAYLFGTEFTRDAVQKLQQSSYDRALEDFELTVSNSALTTRAASQEEATHRAMQIQQLSKFMERLRRVKPTGRVVLGIAPDGNALPDLPLENGDQLHVPPRPTTVQVFGSVFNTGSFTYQPGTHLDRYVKLAGGIRRGADEGSIFVLRADGSVKSNRQYGWGGDVRGEDALPGDTIFVPEEMDKTTLLQSVKDFSTIFLNFGLGAVALKVLVGL